MNIGPYTFHQPIALAPMAGVADRPMRILCRRYGADYAVGEMITAKTALWSSKKTRSRLDFAGEPTPRIVQIAGAEAEQLAVAAERAVARGADVIDINMGCPAKKVLNRAAGSALLKDEALVTRLLHAVIGAVRVPVTLKIRTGWDPANRNGVRIAQIAEDAGVAALSVHGRTRACGFRNTVEYETISLIKQAVGIAVIANGDIVDGRSAIKVLTETGADGLMIGRGAQGRPWIFAELKAALAGQPWQPPAFDEQCRVMAEHLNLLHQHYGDEHGVRIARKHIGWYLNEWPGGRAQRSQFFTLNSARAQLDFVQALAQPGWDCAA